MTSILRTATLVVLAIAALAAAPSYPVRSVAHAQGPAPADSMPARPRTLADSLELALRPYRTALGPFEGVALVGFRGARTPESQGGNRRGVYDDVVVVARVYADTAYVIGGYLFNSDPSASGFNRNRGHYYASVEPGLYWYVRGLHRQRTPGLRQAPGDHGLVSVLRDAPDAKVSSGHFGINFHPGGRNTTGSEGCQTLPPEEWRRFKQLVYRYSGPLIPYVLVGTSRWPSGTMGPKAEPVNRPGPRGAVRF